MFQWTAEIHADSKHLLIYPHFWETEMNFHAHRVYRARKNTALKKCVSN